MTSYGGYETVREISRSGFAAVYTACAIKGDKSEKYAVKVFQSGDAVFDQKRLNSETELLLESAREQQKLTTSNAQHWAPIHEIGSTDKEAYYVTDYFPRSLQQLIYGRIKLPAATLHAIVDSIVKGLLELKHIANRPHGNLKTTNVFIAGEGNVERLKVALTDPIAASNMDSRKSQAADFHDLGELIYQLVTHRPFSSVGGWPIPDGPEWTRLGKQAQTWRALCNRLLTPHLEPEALTLEDVEQKLTELRVKKTKKLTVILVAITAIIIAATVVLITNKTQKPAEIVGQDEWAALCYDYRNWIWRLKVDDALRDRLNNMSADGFVRKRLLDIIDQDKPEGIILNPQKMVITKYGTYPPDELAKKSIEEVLEKSGRKMALAAIEQIRKIRGAFGNDWKIPAQLQKRAEKWAVEDDEQLKNIKTTLNAISTSFRNKINQPNLSDRQALSIPIAQVLLARNLLFDLGSQPEIDKLVGQAMKAISSSQTLAELFERYDKIKDSIIQKIEKPGDWLRNIRELRFASGAVNKLWVKNRDGIVSDITADQLRKDPSRYGQVRRKIEKIREFLNGVDDPCDLPKRISKYAKGKIDRDWYALLYQKIIKKREETLQTLVREIPWNNDTFLPKIEIAALKTGAGWTEQAGNFKNWHTGITGLFIEYSTIKSKLDVFELQVEKPAGADELLKEADLKLTFRPVNDLLKNIAGIKSETDRQKLALSADKAGQEPVLNYAAWGRLGELENPPWPHTLAELEQDTNVQTRLKRIFRNKFAASNEDRLKSLQQELDKQGTLRKIVFNREQIKPYQTKIAGYISNLPDETILRDFGAYINRLKDQTQNLPPAECLTILKKNIELAVQLEQFLIRDWPDIQHQLFIKESEVYKDFPGSAAYETYKQWLSEVKNYKIIADPREQWPELLNKLAKDIERMPSDLRRDRTEKFDGLKAEIAKVQNKTTLPAIEMNRERIVAADEQLKKFQKTLVPDQDYVNRFKEKTAKGEGVPPCFKNIWSKISANAQKVKADHYFYEVEYKVDQIKEKLSQYVTDIFPVISVEPIADKNWIKTLAKLPASHRQQCLNELAEALSQTQIWVGGYPNLQDNNFIAVLDRLKEKYQKWSSLNNLISDFNRIEDRLNAFYPLTEIKLKDDKTAIEAFGHWQQHDLSAEQAVKNSLSGIVNLINDLRKIKSIARTDLAKTPGLAKTRSAVAYAAWRQLAELSEPVWPQTQDELDQDDKTRRKLANIVENTVAQAPRKQELLLELQKEAQRRKQVYLKAEIGRCREIITLEAQKHKDKVLTKFGNFADDELKNNAQLEELKNTAMELRKFLQGDWQQVEQNELKKSLKQTPADSISSATFRNWTEVADGCVRLEPDPRKSVDWDAGISDINKLLEKLISFRPQRAAELRRELTSWKDEQLTTVRQKPAIRKNSKELEKLVGNNKNWLKSHKLKVLKELETPTEWRNRIQKHTIVTTSETIKKEWIRQRDDLLGKVTVAELEKDDWKLYFKIRSEMDNYESFLTELDDENRFPKSLPVNDIPERVIKKPWFANIKKAMATERENTFKKAFGLASKDNGASTAADQAIQKLSDTYRKNRKDSVQLVIAFSDIEDYLNLAYQPDEIPSGALETETIRSLYNKQKKYDIYPTLKSEFSLITNRIGKLLQVEAEKSKQQITQTAQKITKRPSDYHPEIIIAVWNSLKKVTGPISLTELTLARNIRRAVAELINNRLPQGDRKNALMQTFKQEGPRRWEYYFNNLSKPEKIEDNISKAIDLMNDFNVDVEQLKTTQAKYNIYLYRQTSEVIPALTKESKAKDEIKRIKENINSIFLRQAQSPETINKLLIDLDKLLADDSGAQLAKSLTQIGPAKRDQNWRSVPSADMNTVTFTWQDKGYDLIFERIQGAGYMCTTEVSLRLFRDVMLSHRKGTEFKKLLPKNQSEVSGKNMTERPWGWRWSGAGIIHSNDATWLPWFNHTIIRSNPIYRQQGYITKDELFNESARSRLRVLKPSLDHPMQNISLAGAAYFADLLGCRLPTTTEWQCAYREMPDFPDDCWNLRDQTWREHQQHLFGIQDKMAQKRMTPFVPWPDTGIFRPGRKRGKNAVVNIQSNDGVLWFKKVTDDIDKDRTYKFHHLVGNVAEFVCEDADSLDKKIEAPFTNADEVKNFLTHGNYYVIGGSALSAPESTKTTPYKVPYKTSKPKELYSDVGFRLAFSSPHRKLSEELLGLLRRSYILESREWEKN
ncbi:MAG: SUMF1/EgtB/PvdO family nonheme iron enzyme [Sedimentisphaerales bacterium]|nr:SUMF1/EgtB/PvdO family nonheme iron enzyme [Sedimentisphaerales bacterium]